MKKRLRERFFLRPGETVAKELLGKYIVGEKEARITEVELYKGTEDQASHAYQGKVTSRNKAMWQKGGTVYVYLIYGMHWMFNISANIDGVPDCVLIRAVKMKDLSPDLTNGPGKVCKQMGIDDGFYGLDITRSDLLRVEDRGNREGRIKKGERIGINCPDDHWRKAKLRFFID